MILNRKITTILILFSFLAISGPLSAATIHVAVASNFINTAKQLAHQYQQQTGHEVLLSSGSSGKLFLQISNGAPFDLFLSADLDKPRRLIQLNLAYPKSIAIYAKGKLLLWQKANGCTHLRDSGSGSGSSSASDSTQSGSSPLELAPPELEPIKSIEQFAIANPKLAPFGAASKQLLIQLNWWDKLQGRLVFPENIAQVAQLVKLGIVDAALVSASHKDQLQASVKGCFRTIEQDLNIQQALVIINTSRHVQATQQFVDFIMSEKSQFLIKNEGYWPIKPAKIAP